MLELTKTTTNPSNATMGNSSSGMFGPATQASALTEDDDEIHTSFKIESLHGNLMRSQCRRDPMKFYEVIEVIGEGSMGSVSKVRKRDIGGSARPDFVSKETQGFCFQLFSFCLPKSGRDKFVEHESSRTASLSSSSNPIQTTPNKQTNHIVLHHKASSLISYGGKKDVVYALKSLILNRVSTEDLMEELKNEVAIMRGLDHPHIVKAIETFDYRERLYLVLEICNGGDLYSRDPYTEQQACEIVRNLFSAISYLHSKNVVHRDLKMENIMFVSSSRTSEVKIIDFGLSQKYAKDTHMHNAVGTVYTMAPELLGKDYDNKVDVWSLGVITFMLLSSSMPFFGKDRVQVIKRILKAKYKFSSKRWRQISSAAKSFVEKLLVSNPETRPTADEVQHIPWLSESFDDDGTEAGNKESMDNVQAAIQAFAGYGKLKKLGLMVVAYKSTSDEIGHLRKVFNKFDKLKCGEISLGEFKEAFLEDYNYSEDELEKLFMGIDIDGTGRVHYSEFLAATIESHGSIDEERLAEAFDRIDSDDSGFITVANLKEFLGDDIPDKYLEDIINEADLRQDHRIAYDEFLALWNDDGDQALTKAKAEAKARRFNRESSIVSSVSSMEELTTDTDSTHISGTGSFYYEQQKEKDETVQSDWV